MVVVMSVVVLDSFSHQHKQLLKIYSHDHSYATTCLALRIPERGGKGVMMAGRGGAGSQREGGGEDSGRQNS